MPTTASNCDRAEPDCVASVSVGLMPGIARSLGLIFAPGEPDDEGVERSEECQTNGDSVGQPVQLVCDERAQESDHARVGPQLVA